METLRGRVSITLFSFDQSFTLDTFCSLRFVEGWSGNIIPKVLHCQGDDTLLLNLL